jgi:hypothetical protein
MAEPLIVRHVRLVPDAALQSSDPHWTALLAEQVKASDGAPDATLVFPVAPTPPWLRQTVQPNPQKFDPPDRVMDTVMPVAVAPTAPVYRYMVQYWLTTTDCRNVHVTDPPDAVGALRVSTLSAPDPMTTSRSPLTTSNVGVVLGLAELPNPTVGVL